MEENSLYEYMPAVLSGYSGCINGMLRLSETGRGELFDSIPERVEREVDFARTEGNIDSIESWETEDNMDFNETNGGQDGTVFISDQADSISVDITAENVIVVEVDTNLVLYQKTVLPRLPLPVPPR